MPKVAKYLAKRPQGEERRARSGSTTTSARAAATPWLKELEKLGVKVVADISTDPGQVDFSGAVLKAKQSNADALFVYTNEEESRALLRELRKQGYDKPIVGETCSRARR
jgi:branched-chain amino acid transport system substrate-binding protein